jgi:parallel beta-helix repeat protein
MPTISSSGETIYVDGNQLPGWYDDTHVHTIGEALDVAQSGDTIYVYSGEYDENNLVVDVSLDFTAESGTYVKNPDTKNYSTFIINADEVSISGFSMKTNLLSYTPQERDISDEFGVYSDSRNGETATLLISGDSASISNCEIYGFGLDGFGIDLEYANYCSITDCNIYNNLEGIKVENSNHNTIQTCEIYNCAEGIDLFYMTEYNTIEDCHLYDNHYDSIHVQYSSNTQITGCLSENNGAGITQANSIYTTMQDNEINNCYYSFGVGGASLFYYNNDIDTSNTINDKPIYYEVGKNNLVFDENMDIGYLQLYQCSNILIENKEFTHNVFGIILADCHDCTIENCNFETNELEGIVLIDSYDNDILNCICNNSFYIGIYLENSIQNNIENSHAHDIVNAGIQIENSDSNTFISCESYNNGMIGMRLTSSDYCEISDCYIHDNTQWGIALVETSNNNEFYDCIIDANLMEGFYIYTGTSQPSIDNTIYHNNLINNNPNAVDQGTNQWDNGNQGNFWNDYTGVDTNQDGIGDTPYSISGGNSQDRYPVMDPTKNVRPVKPDTPTGTQEGQTGRTYTYSTKTNDYNGDNVYYQWDWGDGTVSDWDGPHAPDVTLQMTHEWDIEGVYQIKVKAKDTSGFESLWSDPLPVTMPLIYIGSVYQGSNYQSIENHIEGTNFEMSYKANAEYMGAYLQPDPGTSPLTKCMIYEADNFTLVGTTEEKTLDAGEEAWVIYQFSDPKPCLQPDTEYTLVCWSNESCNIAYNTTPNQYGRSKSLSYGTPPPAITWDQSQLRIYSIYCSYSTVPDIRSTTATPSLIGFGFNTTIIADISHYEDPLESVNISITYPDTNTKNFTMTQRDNSTFHYLFNDSWVVGNYVYAIWVKDIFGVTTASKGHSFNVSAQATISIATLKDTYGYNWYINITDPPNPLENLTLVGRGLTWDKFYNATSGCNILEVSPSPINYQEDNGTWTSINDSLSQLPSNHPAYNYGYRVGNERGLFGVYFKPNTQSNWPVAFTYNKSDDPITYVVRSKLVGVGYVDPMSDWAYQYLQSAQSSQGQFTGNTARYQNIFTGTNVTWSYSNTELKEEITMTNATKTVLQNHPPHQYGLHDASSYLVFITKLDHQDLNLYNNSGLLTGNVTISNVGVDFRDALGYFKCALPLGEAYELNNGSVRQRLTFRIIQYNGETYLLSGLKMSDLTAMTFPVVIDPTLSVNSLSNDGYIYSSSTNYNTAWSASSGTVESSATYLTIGQKTGGGLPNTYYVYRGFVLFNTSALPSNAYLDSTILSLYKKDDYSTTNFQLTVQNGQPTYPHNPIQTGDYGKSHYSGNGGSLNTANFVNGRNNITLTNCAFAAVGTLMVHRPPGLNILMCIQPMPP